jgi:hypothetical protein
MDRNYWLLIILFFLVSCSVNKNYNQTNLLKCEESQIIVDSNAFPSVKLAAKELQFYIKKISNKLIPILNTSDPEKNYTIYVGESKYTRDLNITLNSQKEEIRIFSKDDFLVLIGKDSKFYINGPINKNYDDIDSVTSEWDKITNNKYGHPLNILFKNYSGKFDIWENETNGTLNAVYEYLHFLGVRWYFPGDLGEVLPTSKVILLPEINISRKASFPVRNFYFYYQKYFMANDEFLKWRLRLKNDNGAEIFGNIIDHGMSFVHSRDEFKKANNDTYAIINGNRDKSKFNYGTPCLSSEIFFDHHVDFLKKYFETFEENTMSIMPGDGFNTICECNKCSIKNPNGLKNNISDYLWGYINKVSKRVLKDVPNKSLSCFAYATYLEPPSSILKFSKNLKLGICYPINGRKDKEEFLLYKDLVLNWKEKLFNDSILIWDYYLYTDNKRNYGKTPVLFTKFIDSELRFLHSQNSYGKFIEVNCKDSNSDNKFSTLAYDHLNIYLSSRLLWNINESTDDIINEYFDLFYGPANSDIKTIFNYIENHWQEINELNYNERILKDLEVAKKKTKEGSVYFKRIQLLINYFN